MKKMKRHLKRAGAAFLAAVCLLLYGGAPVSAQEGPGSLYALSAVLMDGQTGRVLYGKDADTVRAMASTTKVMTCILALEHANGADEVVISDKAAIQPEIKMHVKKGERYRMQDLLYAMMLKSYNDVAVAVAEHIGGSVSGFAEMMNSKALALGCKATHFVTPNGLDAIDEKGEMHSTTAADLALIMRYAIQNPTFLSLTQMRDYSFWDMDKTRNFTIHNANAYLDMREGMISGKTGFTGNAGYCYVGAYESKGRVFIVALLGCGWPNNKTYKWRDMDTLLNYGEEQYHLQEYWQEPRLLPVIVENGIPDSGDLTEAAYTDLTCRFSKKASLQKVLMRQGEEVKITQTVKETVTAPVQEGEKLGEIVYSIDDFCLASYDLLAKSAVERLTMEWCVEDIFRRFFHD